MGYLSDYSVSLSLALVVSALCSLLFPCVCPGPFPYIRVVQIFSLVLLVTRFSTNKLAFYMGFILKILKAILKHQKVSLRVLMSKLQCYSYRERLHLSPPIRHKDAFICLDVSCNYCQLSGSKIWFPFSFYGTVSGILFRISRIHVYTDKFRLSQSLHSALSTGSPRALHSISRQTCCHVGIPFAGRFIPRIANLSLE